MKLVRFVPVLAIFSFFLPVFVTAQVVTPIYGNTANDASVGIKSSFNFIIQTLGTGLSGTLTRVDLNTSNLAFLYYANRPTFALYECNNETYNGFVADVQDCIVVYSGVSDERSQLFSSVQSLYFDSIVLNPSKYYFFRTAGSNIFNTLPIYYGSASDTVEGSCHQFIQSQGIYIPCETVSDLYFNFYGVEKLATTTEGNSNVLFIPGFQGSRLYRPSPIGSGEVQLWEPSGNADVETLYLNFDGTSINPNVYTKDIILETNVPVPTGPAGQNIYKNFSDTMNGLVTEQKINKWESYAYDWRQSVEDIVDNGTSYADGKVSVESMLAALAQSSKNGKVSIIAHSNGGLIAKALLKKLQDDKIAGRNDLIDKVDVLILVAVPEIGTAKAVPAMLHGYDSQMLFGWLMDEVRARELGRNMIGAYGLLPSRAYIEHISASPVTFVGTVPNGPSYNLFQTYGSAINSYAEYKDFLFGAEGRVSPQISQTELPIKLTESIFAEAESLHTKIDNFVPPSTMRVIEVAGWGLDTLASFEYYTKVDCNSNSGPSGCTTILDQRPRFTIDGDKTVVTPSAQYMSFQGNAERYWVDLKEHNKQFFLGARRNREHKDIFEVNSLNDFISSSIKQESPVMDLVFRNSQPINTSNVLRLAVHSPVTLDAFDANGNHTGKVCPSGSDFCYVEESILNSTYLEFGEGKYVNMPEEELSKIVLFGTDIGTFTYESEKIFLDGTSVMTSFVDIPVTTQSQAEITASTTTGTLEMKLDVTGDGVVDFTLSPSAEFEPIVYLKIMKTTIESLDLPQAKKTAFSKRVDNIIRSIEKGKIDKAKLKADKFVGVLEKKLTKPDPKYPKQRKISKTDAQILLDMLNKLLDNLG